MALVTVDAATVAMTTKRNKHLTVILIYVEKIKVKVDGFE